MVRATFLAVLAGAASLAAAPQLQAQEYDYDPGLLDQASPSGVAIGVRGGVVMTTPRGSFPSLIVGDSRSGSGSIGAAYGSSGTGNRIALSALIPLRPTYGVTLEIGSLTWSAKYGATETSRATRFDVQSLQGAITFQGNVFTDSKAFRGRGLRSVYLDGGVEVGILTLGNRVESGAYPDSAGPSVAAVGSFENDEPFRHLVALRSGVGMRFAVDTHLELQIEGNYSYSLNDVFSGEALRDNDFTVDNLSGLVGIFYRF